MTDEVVKKIPEILESPVVVMKSRTVADRLTLLGEVTDANGFPVVVALDTNPKSVTQKNGISIDTVRVLSAYGKDTDPKDLLIEVKFYG